ncbi:MAG: PEP-CTERM sorting domain-containing protein [Phycisphaerae bacterium]|nr:PEP-CTERM sorting domain-containing protein [Phycisphaerae bacterium]
MKKVSAILATVGLLALAVSSQVVADPVQWTEEGGNGHWYELVSEPPQSWQDAKAAAELCHYLGMTGHLATITSPEEHDFLVDEFWQNNAMWVGGWQNHDSPDYSEPSGGWEWIEVPYLPEPEPWDYTNWAPTQPDNSGGEDCLDISSTQGKWNDMGCSTPLPYVVEYAPEPATLSLLALGGLAIVRRRRRCRA